VPSIPVFNIARSGFRGPTGWLISESRSGAIASTLRAGNASGTACGADTRLQAPRSGSSIAIPAGEGAGSVTVRCQTAPTATPTYRIRLRLRLLHLRLALRRFRRINAPQRIRNRWTPRTARMPSSAAAGTSAASSGDSRMTAIPFVEHHAPARTLTRLTTRM